MNRYDPLVAPDPVHWLALDEQVRIDMVEDYHRTARIQLPRSTPHAIAHVIVENQGALGDEIPVQRTLQRLMSEGLDRHDAIHAVGSVLMWHLNEIMAGRREAKDGEDPLSPYYAELERLTAEEWLRSG
jgi:hypothetical protein